MFGPLLHSSAQPPISKFVRYISIVPFCFFVLSVNTIYSMAQLYVSSIIPRQPVDDRIADYFKVHSHYTVITLHDPCTLPIITILRSIHYHHLNHICICPPMTACCIIIRLLDLLLQNL